jgi:hypothetical protein
MSGKESNSGIWECKTLWGCKIWECETGGLTDLQADRDDSGEASPECLPELGSRLTPEDQGGKGAEQQAGTIQPADCWEAVQDSLQA